MKTIGDKLMLLPQPRRNLKNTNSHNKSLQDIVKSCSKATEVLSVETYNGKVHNTKITLLDLFSQQVSVHIM